MTGYTQERVTATSENSGDQCAMPQIWAIPLSKRIEKKESAIHGSGMFALEELREDCILGPAKISGFRTFLSRFMNHAKFPNCRYFEAANKDLYLVATRVIAPGEELTVSYYQLGRVNGHPDWAEPSV
jgi:hypothetical protein